MLLAEGNTVPVVREVNVKRALKKRNGVARMENQFLPKVENLRGDGVLPQKYILGGQSP